MAVELEKIAALLEEAHENISNLEKENSELKDENAGLVSQMELQKEASVSSWDNDNDMGSAVDYTSPEHATPENRLDDFLAD